MKNNVSSIDEVGQFNDKNILLVLEKIVNKVPESQIYIRNFQHLIYHLKDVNCQNKNGFSAMHFAAQLGDYTLMEVLISLGGDINLQNDFRHTPFMLACINNKTSTVKNLLSKKEFLNFKSYDIQFKTSLFHVLDMYKRLNLNDFSLMNLVRDHDPNFKQNINHQDFGGNTILILATINRLHVMAKYLLDNGADPTITDVLRECALHKAVKNNDEIMIKLLSKTIVSLNNLQDTNRQTSTKLVAEKEVSVEKQDLSINSPLKEDTTSYYEYTDCEITMVGEDL